MLQPNQAALLTLFGSYRDTDRNDGLRWEDSSYVKKKVPVRARNFNSEKLKVNDMRSNPIENAAAIVWKIDDTAQATFDVDNFEAYAGGQHRHAVQLSERPRTEQTEPMASPDKKSFLLRIDPQLWAGSSGSPRPSCAERTRKSNTCCEMRCKRTRATKARRRRWSQSPANRIGDRPRARCGVC